MGRPCAGARPASSASSRVLVGAEVPRGLVSVFWEPQVIVRHAGHSLTKIQACLLVLFSPVSLVPLWAGYSNVQPVKNADCSHLSFILSSTKNCVHVWNLVYLWFQCLWFSLATGKEVIISSKAVKGKSREPFLSSKPLICKNISFCFDSSV